MNPDLAYLVLSFSLAGAWGTAAPPSPPAAAPSIPAEEERFNSAVFRAGLKKLGLTELLELHLKDFPPSGETEKRLMLREVRLAQFADRTRTRAERLKSLDEANRILETLIERTNDDPRRFDWRMSLARSLIFEEAEPQLTNVLYRIAGPRDRHRLRSLMTRAVTDLRGLSKDVGKELTRVESLSARAFDRLQSSGYIEKLDRLGPNGEYLLLWALLYESLTRADNDIVRVEQLNEIVDRFGANPALLNTPHEVSHVQIQALLLSGMTHRLLNDHAKARDRLDRALTAAEQLSEPDELKRVDWAVTLARLERIRNEAEAGRTDRAFALLAHFRERIKDRGEGEFGQRLMAAFLERSVYRLQAARARRSGRWEEADVMRRRAWRALSLLARGEPKHRDELYAVLYDAIPLDTNPSGLDPMEQSALVAGLLFEADQVQEKTETRLERAVGIGEAFLRGPNGRDETLRPEVLYNIAVAEYKRGRIVASVNRFLEVAREHPTFVHAAEAASLAVQLASEKYEDPAHRGDTAVTALYRNALQTLTDRYPDGESARYWRFYYAQLLDELGEYASAAKQYALVDEHHEHQLEALFFQARCLALELLQRAESGDEDVATLKRMVDSFRRAGRAFIARATAAVETSKEPGRIDALNDLLARIHILTGEVDIAPTIDRAQHALDTLAGFEESFPRQKTLSGRVWRVRLVAYQQLGRLDEATRAIPTYLSADPEDAGGTLQSLYRSLAGDIQRLRAQGNTALADRQAGMALVLATQIYQWALGAPQAAQPGDRRALTVQLAEANLQAGQYEKARALFEPLVGSITQPKATTDVRVVYGFAESLYRLDRPGDALPWFNRLATGMAATDPIRFKALLRDLQCRTALGQPPKDVIQVIDQQERLYPHLGGPATASALKRLRRDNRFKLDNGG